MATKREIARIASTKVKVSYEEIKPILSIEVNIDIIKIL